MQTEIFDGQRMNLEIGEKKRSKGADAYNVEQELASLKHHVKVNKRKLSD